MEQVRSFVAIELSDDVKRRLAEAQASLGRKGIADQVRWVNPPGMHMTLKFLGNVPLHRVSEITLGLEQASKGIRSFSLSFGGLGCFPSTRRPNVIWIGILGDTQALALLQHRIEQNLAVLGFSPERRGYSPHLTLGRVGRHVGNHERRRLGRLIETETVDPFGEMKVQEVSLMKSVLSPAGATYSRLAAVLLE